jgi:tetratricopeptide (TPR) repeat protein
MGISGGSGPVARSRRILVLTALVVVAATPASASLWYEDYASALRAMRAEEWDQAVAYLEQAIQNRPESCVECKTYGMNFIDYFPYLKQGICQYQLGNHDAALALFRQEELLGAIADSTRDLGDLEGYRELAQKARDVARIAERTRQAGESLDRAELAEREGRLEDALTEVEKALGFAPENAKAVEMKRRLQATLTVRQEERDRRQRFDALLAEGRRKLSEGEYSDAAVDLAQAEILDPSSAEAKDLLQQARSAAAEQARQQQDERQRQRTIEDGLTRAREAEQKDDLDGAIGAVQSVLNVDPENTPALAMLPRLLEAKNREDLGRQRDDEVQTLLTQAGDLLDEGDYQGAYALTVRALIRDSLSPDAIAMLDRVQTRLQRELVGTVGEVALQPFISFTNDRREENDESNGPGTERVHYPNFTLSGAVISSGPLAKLEYAVNGLEVALDVGAGSMLDNGQMLTQFQLSHTLPAGQSTFEVLAADSSGKSMSRDYLVVYVVPFYQARWFYASLLAVFTAVGIGLYAWKRVARRQRLKRRFNPYVAGAPILHDDLFFGRENLMTRVLQTLHNNSILLYGERRIGKTSFQHRLKRRLSEIVDAKYDFYPIYIDLQGIPEKKFFSTLAHDIFEELEPVLDGVGPGEALSNGADYGYRDLVRDLRNVLATLKSRSAPKRVKLVLLIDEVDELNSYDPRINQRLRSLFMRNFAEDLAAVVSGVSIKKQWESEGSPWYNFFEEIPVKPFRKEDAVDLIERPIRGVFKLESGVTDRIITVTECKPFLIQKMCVSLVNRLHEERRNVITLTDVDTLGQPQER